MGIFVAPSAVAYCIYHCKVLKFNKNSQKERGISQMQEIKITRNPNPKDKPTDESKLGFGKLFSDHMFMMDYKTGEGWHNARIVPYGPISLSPASSCLHYGQTVFEGMKAYYGVDGEIRLFRPDENFKRLNASNERLCIPAIDEELCVEAVKKLVELDKDWVPRKEGTSLYIRPFIIGNDDFLGVKAADEYYFIIIVSPSGAYYASGLAPVRIYVENEYVRAVRGGTGAAKTGGNYASSLLAQDQAHEQGYSQVLWLDGVERKYIEEVGAMNVFFVVDGEVITPMLGGSILPGITRKSSIELLKSWGIPVTERLITAQELADAYDAGKLEEAFGTGTAAVVSPVGELKWGDKVMSIGNGKIGAITQRLYDAMTGIQYGKLEDVNNWTIKVCKG